MTEKNYTEKQSDEFYDIAYNLVNGQSITRGRFIVKADTRKEALELFDNWYCTQYKNASIHVTYPKITKMAYWEKNNVEK